MKRTFIYKIESADLPQTVHSYLRTHGYSRHILASLKPHPDAVLRNGEHVWFSDKLQEQDVLTVTVQDDVSSVNIKPAPVPFSILFEDEDLMVINKPAGVSIHPAINHPADTLANGIAQLYQERGIPYVFRCINRLDRDTTGLLILANNVLSASILEQALQRREISRTYLAVAEGTLPPEGTIDLPIGRKEASLIERCVDPEHGDRAVTHFRTLDVFPHPCSSGVCSLVELKLETGRTHQIRVHMAATGHPLMGDTLYNPACRQLFPGNPESRDKPGSIGRQALHARKLSFTHPITGKAMQFTAPFPDDMAALLPDTLRQTYSK